MTVKPLSLFTLLSLEGTTFRLLVKSPDCKVTNHMRQASHTLGKLPGCTYSLGFDIAYGGRTFPKYEVGSAALDMFRLVGGDDSLNQVSTIVSSAPR